MNSSRRDYTGLAFAGGLVLCGAALVASLHRQSSYLPDQKMTPGDVLTTDLELIREPNYSKGVRNVSESEKVQVALRYGVDPAKLSGYEVDHLIPLSWGGSNAIENLWPESYAGPWNARVKDRLEVHGLALIRRGELDAHEAQQAIAKDWVGMYQRLISSVPQEHQSQEHEQ